MGYIGSDPRNKDSVTTSQLVDDAVTNAKLVDDVLFSSVTSSIVSASGNITADTFTGTFNGALSSSAQIATSISGSSTSLSSSLSTRATTLESASGSFASDLVTLKGSGTAQGVGTSDSPTFADATITGTLTAQEVHTEFESASVIFTSGSTIFGNSSDDIHNMTGSLNVSGAINLNDGDLIVTDNIGIGTSTVVSQLHLAKTSGEFGIKLTNNATGHTSSDGVHFNLDGNNDLNLGTKDSTNIVFKTADSERVRIKSDGKVGIGTNNPDALLQISGSGLNGAPTLAIDNTSTSSYIHSIEALGGAMTSNQINIINLGKIGSTKNSGVIGYKWVSAGSDDNLLTFEHWGTGPLTTINGKGKVTINADTSGDYGCFINNSNSGGYGLRIAGGASSADYLIRGQNEGGTDKFVVKSDGSTTISGGITGPTDTHMSYTTGQAIDTASGGAFHAEGSDVIAGRYFFQGYNADGGKLVGFNNESDQLVMYNYADGNYMAKYKYGGDFYPMADVIMASGRGISFAADSNHGAMESELLDDYEEGTWEPTFEPQTNSYTSITYQTDTGGRYTKIGNLVVCQGCVRYDSITIGSATGYLYIGGFPFTSRGRTNGDNDDSPFILFSTANGNNWNSNNKLPLWGYRGVGNTRASLYYQASVGSAPVILNVSDQGTTGYNRIHFVCVYHSTV